jgi:hypothetical protein
MSITVAGQHIIKAKIGPYEDSQFIRGIEELLLIEEYDGRLPTFSFTFLTDKEELAAYLHEGNVLRLGLGQSEEDIIEADFVIQRTMRSTVAQSMKYTILGCLNKLPYIKDTDVVVYKAKDGVSTLDLIRQISGKYFEFDTNVTATQDKNTYAQSKMSDKSLLNQMVARLDLRPSLALSAVTFDGKFRVIDVDKAKQTAKHKIAVDAKGGELIAEGNAGISDNTGPNNREGTIGLSQYVQSLEEGKTSKFNTEITPKIGMSSYMPFGGFLTKQMPLNVPGTEDVPSSSLAVRTHARTKEQTLNNYELTLNLTAKHPRIMPLDVVEWREPSLKGDGSDNFETQGKWLVKKTVYSLQDEVFHMSLVVVRDTLNDIKGNQLGFSVGFLNFLKSLLTFVGAIPGSLGFDFNFNLSALQKLSLLKMLTAFKQLPELLDRLRSLPSGLTVTAGIGLDSILDYRVNADLDFRLPSIDLSFIGDFPGSGALPNNGQSNIFNFGESGGSVSSGGGGASASVPVGALTIQDLGLEPGDVPKGASLVFTDLTLEKQELADMDLGRVMAKLTENELGPTTGVSYYLGELIGLSCSCGEGVPENVAKAVLDGQNMILKPIAWDLLKEPTINDSLGTLATVEEAQASTFNLELCECAFKDGVPPVLEMTFRGSSDFVIPRRSRKFKREVQVRPLDGEFPEGFLDPGLLDAVYLQNAVKEGVESALPEIVADLDFGGVCLNSDHLYG